MNGRNGRACVQAPDLGYAVPKRQQAPAGSPRPLRGRTAGGCLCRPRPFYKPDAAGRRRLREAACWAHLRRDIHDVWKATSSKIAREALERIGALYDIERGRGAGRSGPFHNYLVTGEKVTVQSLSR